MPIQFSTTKSITGQNISESEWKILTDEQSASELSYLEKLLSTQH